MPAALPHGAAGQPAPPALRGTAQHAEAGLETARAAMPAEPLDITGDLSNILQASFQVQQQHATHEYLLLVCRDES